MGTQFSGPIFTDAVLIYPEYVRFGYFFSGFIDIDIDIDID